MLVVHKPAGLNTHAPSPFAGEGAYEWLRDREPRWASLAILHRLDKETSGILLFGKTPEANRSLTAQFTAHTVHKRYLLITDRKVPRREITVVSHPVKRGEIYVSRPAIAGGQRAETTFRVISAIGANTLVEARPHTGRTHQIRVHAAENGFPVLGDRLYGGTPAARLFLHAQALQYQAPLTGIVTSHQAEPGFDANPQLNFRQLLVDPGATNAVRLLNGSADGSPGLYLERLGDFLLVGSAEDLTDEQRHFLESILEAVATSAANSPPLQGVYHKVLNRHVRRSTLENTSPSLLKGSPAPERFSIRENGLAFELSLQEGYSTGLFLDQRDNRRRLLLNHVAAGFPLFANGPAGAEVLNTFAYTCGFSVCAARAGARTTSLDLSKKYLDWGRRNFLLNHLDPEKHDFIYGDVFDWLRRLAKKQRAYDLIILDPPTFSQSKQHGAFQVTRDYPRLVTAALPVLKPGSVLLASTNASELAPERFLEGIERAIAAAGRRILRRHYAPQPPDFRISTEEPAYLKTVWLRIQ